MRRWLTTKEAAEYCGYSVKKFREYAIPRCGPKRNRFDVHDLDAWMKNPEAFRLSQFIGSQRPRVKGEFIPV